MRIILYILTALLLLGCKADKATSRLAVDHVNIWLKNPQIAKEKLEQIGFTGVPDSLCKVHEGQGTTGRYFYFLNSYLELIFVYDEEEFKTNTDNNKELDFNERYNSPDNGFLPFSISLKMEDYGKEKLPFEAI